MPTKSRNDVDDESASRDVAGDDSGVILALESSVVSSTATERSSNAPGGGAHVGVLPPVPRTNPIASSSRLYAHRSIDAAATGEPPSARRVKHCTHSTSFPRVRSNQS